MDADRLEVGDVSDGHSTVTEADDSTEVAQSDGDDADENYDETEAKLQQERINYLQTMKKREAEDAAAARQIMQEELLKIEREKLCRVMQDEELARRLQAEEEQQQGVTQATDVRDTANDANLNDDSDDGYWLEDGRGNTNLTNFDNALYFSGLPVESTHDDEELARRLQAEEEKQRRSARPTYVDDRANEDRLSDDSDDGDWLEDRGGNTDLRNFDNALYFSGLPVESTHDDELLARALQQSEQEDAGHSVQQQSDWSQQQNDAYLAHILQNTERISAMRRQHTTTTTQSTVTVHRQMSVPSTPSSQDTQLSLPATPSGAAGGVPPPPRRRASTPTYVLHRFPDPVTTQTDGSQGTATSTTSAQGAATPTTGAQGIATSTKSKRSGRKSSCKQQ